MVVVSKPCGKRSLGKPRCRTEDAIKIGVKYIKGHVCTGFIWHRIVAIGGCMQL
jgi:hypothetical protein